LSVKKEERKGNRGRGNMRERNKVEDKNGKRNQRKEKERKLS
jgi:hypothetical protein